MVAQQPERLSERLSAGCCVAGGAAEGVAAEGVAAEEAALAWPGGTPGGTGLCECYKQASRV